MSNQFFESDKKNKRPGNTKLYSTHLIQIESVSEKETKTSLYPSFFYSFKLDSKML